MCHLKNGPFSVEISISVDSPSTHPISFQIIYTRRTQPSNFHLNFTLYLYTWMLFILIFHHNVSMCACNVILFSSNIIPPFLCVVQFRRVNHSVRLSKSAIANGSCVVVHCVYGIKKKIGKKNLQKRCVYKCFGVTQ